MTREEKAEYNKIWNAAHKKYRSEYNKKWNATHKEYRKKYNADYWDNKEQRNQYMKDRYDSEKRRDWYLKNRKHHLEVSSNWSKTPKGRVSKNASLHRYKARKKSSGGSFTVEDIKDLYATQGGRCYYCRIDIEAGYHIDHMLPISRGGTNGPENLALACAPCNLSKHTKTAEEFIAC